MQDTYHNDKCLLSDCLDCLNNTQLNKLMVETCKIKTKMTASSPHCYTLNVYKKQYWHRNKSCSNATSPIILCSIPSDFNTSTATPGIPALNTLQLTLFSNNAQHRKIWCKFKKIGKKINYFP